jgi:outer membrane lipoprotein LolB
MDSSDQQHWEGRMAITLYQPQSRAIFANFELQGSAISGRLGLTSPLGITLAELEWAPGSAQLSTANSKVQQYPSLKDLAEQAVGVDIPVAALFNWFRGQAAMDENWEADLSSFRSGKITAVRKKPDAQAEVKIIFA